MVLNATYGCQFLCVIQRCVAFSFQNGFLSAIPFLLMYIITVGGGQVADKLRYSNILTTGEVRKVFATGGEFKCPFIQCIKSQRMGWGGCGNSLIVPFRGLKAIWFLLGCSASERSVVGTNDRRSWDILELASLSSEKHFKPHPQNRILVPLRSIIQNFWRPAPVLFMWQLSPGGSDSKEIMCQNFVCEDHKFIHGIFS